MDNIEKKISDYIDALNEGKKPIEHDQDMESFNYEELMETVRKIGCIKEVDYPDENFEKRLVKNMNKSKNHSKNDNSKKKLVPLYTLAAAIVVVIAIIISVLFMNTNPVRAMAESYQEIKAYHGTLETFAINELGEEVLIQRWEVRKDSDGKYVVNVIDGYQKGITTINNGEQKWQINRDENEIIQYEVFPDYYPFALDLAREIKNAENAIKVKKIGDEVILGKAVIKLEITPDGGNPYYLWVDKESKLPIQRQSAMINALRYCTRYKEITFEDTIPDELLKYEIPEGFTVTDRKKEQLVNNLEDAVAIGGFMPKNLEKIPDKYELNLMTFEGEGESFRTYYSKMDNQKNVVLMQKLAEGEFKPDNTAIIGKINNNHGEYQPNLDNQGTMISGDPYLSLSDYSSIRWQESEFVYTIIGNVSFEELSYFASELSGGSVEFELKSEGEVGKPQVNVEVNMEIERNNQKSVDSGSSPWLLDPAYVTQVWASLMISPEGIKGEYPIAYEDIEMIYNDGKDAIAQIVGEETVAKKVYLKKLVRHDSTGIWTVTGYDTN